MKVVAATLTARGIENMIYTAGLLGTELWQDITHVVVDGLSIFGNGELHTGAARYYDHQGRPCMPAFNKEAQDAQSSQEYMSSIALYIDMLKCIKAAHPHLKFVFKLPDVQAMPHLRCLLNIDTVNSFIEWCKENQWAHAVLVDMCFIDFLLGQMHVHMDRDSGHYRGMDYSWCNQLGNIKLWLSTSFSNSQDRLNTDKHAKVLHRVSLWDSFEYFVVPSYGFFDVRTENMSQRLGVQRMESYCECKLSDFVAYMVPYALVCPQQKFLMGIDTAGVLFTKNGENGRASVYLEMVDRRNIASPQQPNAYMSHDDDSMLRRKLDYVQNNLAGVVIGPMDQDYVPTHPKSLLRKCTQRFSLIQ